MADGGWHHIAVIRNAQTGTVTLYVDAAPQGAVAASMAPLEVASVGFGADQTAVGSYSTRRSFMGSLDDIRIYHRALTAGEIGELAAG